MTVRYVPQYFCYVRDGHCVTLRRSERWARGEGPHTVAVVRLFSDHDGRLLDEVHLADCEVVPIGPCEALIANVLEDGTVDVALICDDQKYEEV